MLKHFLCTKGLKILNLTIAALILIPFAISCSQQKEEEPGQKLHEVKDYTIKYEMEGAREGQRLVYSQDWGKCIMEITGSQKIIALMEDGQQYVISIDLDSNTGTKMLNPIYQSLLESLNAKTPKEFNFAILEQMGGKVVGEKNIIGNNCEVWEMMEGVQSSCITEDGIILESESTASGVERRQVATQVIRGSTEGVDACDPGDAKIEIVNISQMLQQQEIDKPKFELESEENNQESSNQEENSTPEPKK